MKEEFRRFLKDKLFVKTCIHFTVILVCIVCATLDYTRFKYVVQASWVIGIIAIVLLVRTLIKVYKKFFRETCDPILKRWKAQFIAFVEHLDDVIRMKLHLKPRIAYFGGHDEHKNEYSILKKYSTGTNKTKLVKVKWKNLEENRQKIRYLFAQSVSSGIANGYKFRYSYTARKLKADLAKTERQIMLYDLYEDVRYTGHEPEIEDETIEYLLEKEPPTSDGDDKKKKKK